MVAVFLLRLWSADGTATCRKPLAAQCCHLPHLLHTGLVWYPLDGREGGGGGNLEGTRVANGSYGKGAASYGI